MSVHFNPYFFFFLCATIKAQLTLHFLHDLHQPMHVCKRAKANSNFKW